MNSWVGWLLHIFVQNCTGSQYLLAAWAWHKSGWRAIGVYRINYERVRRSAIFYPCKPCQRQPHQWKWVHSRTEKNSDQGGKWTHDLRVATDHHWSTDWATRSDGSRSWELKVSNSQQWICTNTMGQSFSLSSSGSISIGGAGAHMGYMGRK